MASDVISSGDDIGHSAADAGPDDSPDAETEVEPSDSKGNEEPKATLPATPGAQDIAPRPLSKAEINAAFVTPDGHRVSDSIDDLDCDLNTTLARVYGEMLNRGTLETLVGKHGERQCALWAHWLPRKIADEYTKGRPVESPSGLYRKAVEQGWHVDPKWPEFDEERHILAAREQYIKRQLEIKLKSKHSKFTAADIRWLAEEVRKGERRLADVREDVQASVRDEMNHLQEIDDEIASMFSDQPLPKKTPEEDDLDFGLTDKNAESYDELEDEVPF